MKIIFLNPPMCNFTGHSLANSPALGIMYLATVLDQAGYETKVIDAEALGMSWEQLSNRLKTEIPDAVGLTSTTLGMPALYKTADVCRRALPNTKILAGGFGPTLESKKTLKECPAIDIIGIGECEETIIELINGLENNENLSQVKGIAFRGINKEFFQTPSRPPIEYLDSIPFPNYDLLEPKFSAYHGVHGHHQGINLPNAVMMGSRGCPHRCIFCCNANKKPRFRSPKKIVDEIEFYKKKLNVKSIQLYDNEFIGMSSMQNKWIKEICQEIIDRNLNDLGYLCQGRCSKFIDIETLKLMRKANFRWIWWGVESGSQKILDRIKKDLKIEDVYSSFKLAKKAGIYSLMFIMVGFPDETEQDVKKSATLIKKIKPEEIRIHITTPLPGSELWEELYQNGQIDEFDFLKYDTRLAVVHHTNTMSSEDIKKAYRMLLFRFENGYWYFIKFFVKSLLTIDGWKQLRKRIKMVIRYIIDWLKLEINIE